MRPMVRKVHAYMNKKYTTTARRRPRRRPRRRRARACELANARFNPSIVSSSPFASFSSSISPPPSFSLANVSSDASTLALASFGGGGGGVNPRERKTSTKPLFLAVSVARLASIARAISLERFNRSRASSICARHRHRQSPRAVFIHSSCHHDSCMHSFIHRASRRRRRAHRHVLERARVPPRRFFQPRDDVRVSRHPVSSSFTTSDADRVSFIHSPRPTRPRGIDPGSTPTPSHPVPRVRTRPRARATARTRTRSRCSRFASPRRRR